MSYIGNSITQQSFTGGVDQYNGNNSNTVFGLTRTINTVYDVDAYVENVWQRPATGYTVSANTITFTSAPPAGSNNVVVVYRNFTATSIIPQQGSVTTTSFAANAIPATLGFTPLANTSSAITTVLGFTPANKAGDTFSGAVSGITTLAAGNTTITGTANISQSLTANTLTVSTNTATVGTSLYVVANGNVGIGDAAPEAGAKLTIKGGGIAIATDTSTVYPSGCDLKIRSGTAKMAIHAIGSAQNMFLEFSGGNGAAAYINVCSTDSLAISTNSIERLRVDTSGNLKLTTAGTKILNSSGNPIVQQTGSVLQVISVTKSDTFSVAGGGSGSFFDITGLAVTITPTSSTSKILIMVCLSCGSSNAAEHLAARVVRGTSNVVGVGDAIGSRNQAMFAHGINHTDNSTRIMSSNYLDSPATTSATTYKVQGYNNSATFYLNRTLAWSDSNHYSTGASTITVMEIAA